MTMMEDLREALLSFKEEESFDAVIAIYVGGAIGNLTQVGVGLENFEFTLTSTWQEFLGPEAMKSQIYPAAKNYITLYVRTLFDPPAPSTIATIEKVLEESIWRIKVYADSLLEQEGIINGLPS